MSRCGYTSSKEPFSASGKPVNLNALTQGDHLIVNTNNKQPSTFQTKMPIMLLPACSVNYPNASSTSYGTCAEIWISRLSLWT